MSTANNILIVGFGDIGARVAKALPSRYRVSALVRKPADADRAKRLGVTPLRGDLRHAATLAQLARRFDCVLHFAPPPGRGRHDTHTRNLLRALVKPPRRERGGMLSQHPLHRLRRLVYISTTGVYGDCEGDWVDETRRTRPGTARAARRVDAERTLLRWARRHAVKVAILRAPGIYAADRLPLERLRRGTPALLPAEDVFTNHIHADDLARAAILAMKRARGNRIFNAVDDSNLAMGQYFDLVADAFALPRPPRLSRAAAETHLSSALLSFMSESRRIRNDRIKRELGLDLRYPTVAVFLDQLRRRPG